MKKLFLLMCAVAGLLSCAKEIDDIRPEKMQEEACVPMDFNISVDETRAAKTAWANADVIYVFFKGLPFKYVKMVYDGIDRRWMMTYPNGAINNSEFRVLQDKTLTAVHFPESATISWSAIGGFSFSSASCSYYLYDRARSYTVSGTTVTANLSMQKPADMVQIHVAGIDKSLVNVYTFGCPLIKPVFCAGVDSDGSIIENELQAGARLSGIADSDGAIFAGRLTNPGERKDYTFTVTRHLGFVTTVYSLERKNKSLVSGKMYNTPSISNGWKTYKPSDLYVDLGLNVKWMTCNIGASSPEQTGHQVAWGELQPKGWTSWDNYLYWNGSSFVKYTQTNEVGIIMTILQPEDDAVYATWGGGFRMPTYTEWRELRLKCKWEEKTVNGVRGMEVISPFNKNSIFLPFKSGEDDANYWSSELYTDKYDYMHAYDQRLKRPVSMFGTTPRYYQYFVRGVYSGL